MKIPEPRPTTKIDDYAAEMVGSANTTQQVVFGEFNSVEISANPGDNPVTIVNRYYHKCQLRDGPESW